MVRIHKSIDSLSDRTHRTKMDKVSSASHMALKVASCLYLNI